MIRTKFSVKYPDVSADNEAAWCNTRFPDGDLQVWNDEVPNLQSDDPRYEYYSYPLIVANIEVWGGYTL